MASVGSSRGFSLLREAKEFFAFSVTLLQHSDKQIFNKINHPNISWQKPMSVNNVTEMLGQVFNLQNYGWMWTVKAGGVQQVGRENLNRPFFFFLFK